ncbi:MAG: hypothetical protein IPP77_05935 [Bacteroidetes bacterium]|nr:hypothetical protein [Bacteroidota bacterium]
MEIAISHTDTGYKVYVEGLSWQTLTKQLLDESFNIYLLSIYIDGRYTGYDDRVKVNDGKLSFCKQHISMKELLSFLSELEGEEVYEVRLGNGQFFLESLYPGAWVVTFQQKEDAWGFLAGIQEGMSEFINPLLTSGLPVSSVALTDDITGVPTWERFVDRRYNRWHDKVVREFEEGVKNGTISCPGCK